MNVNIVPFVSIIVPSYNSENTIALCIESLLKQTYPKDRYEVIVIDNGSRDNTAWIIKRYPVVYLYEDKIQTPSAARNAGIKIAKGKLIGFTDADCIAAEDWLFKIVSNAEEDTIGCVLGDVKAYKPQNYVEQYLADRQLFSQRITLSNRFLPYAQTGNVFYKKEVLRKIGLFEEKWVSAEDADLSWRMQLNTDYYMKFVPDAIVYHKHRTSVKSMFKQKVNYGIGMTLLYKKYKDKMPNRKYQETFEDFKLWVYFSGVVIKLKLNMYKNASEYDKKKKYFDFLCFAAGKIGKLIGSLKNRVYYV